MFLVKFWGVRGSIPAPLTHKDVREKVLAKLKAYKDGGCPESPEAFLGDEVLTYGGNTSCVEVQYGAKRLVFDMGTGIRALGNALIPEMFQKGGLEIAFLLSHVHWDHIQGLPFFGPIYVNKEVGIRNSWSFYGGTGWQKTAETCLRGQMDPPTFPVSWAEILKITEKMEFCDLYDRKKFRMVPDGPEILCRKLNHPQETYGWRLTGYDGSVVAYTTDQEPYNPAYPDPALLDLAKNADIWITDCQYSQEIYEDQKVPRHGWGHSYPEAVAQAAVQGNVKTVVLFHHDPASSDEKIAALRKRTEELVKELGGKTEVQAAFEGLEMHCGK